MVGKPYYAELGDRTTTMALIAAAAGGYRPENVEVIYSHDRYQTSERILAFAQHPNAFAMACADFINWNACADVISLCACAPCTCSMNPPSSPHAPSIVS
jgi:hypothetical protein